MMERRNVDILCLQETKRKGSTARNIGDGSKLFCNKADRRKNHHCEQGAGLKCFGGEEGVRQT